MSGDLPWSDERDRYSYAIGLVDLEYKRAAGRWGAFNSAHEGYAILLEEVDELWAEVKRKPSVRDLEVMRAEAVQVAAMALRFLVDVCTERGVRR